MFAVCPRMPLIERKLLAETALEMMGEYFCFSQQLAEKLQRHENEYRVAIGLSIGARNNDLLGLHHHGKVGALGLLGAVVSGRHQGDMKESLHLIRDAAVAAQLMPDTDVAGDAVSAEARVFMWRLRKLTAAVRSHEIEWQR